MTDKELKKIQEITNKKRAGEMPVKGEGPQHGDTRGT